MWCFVCQPHAVCGSSCHYIAFDIPHNHSFRFQRSASTHRTKCDGLETHTMCGVFTKGKREQKKLNVRFEHVRGMPCKYIFRRYFVCFNWIFACASIPLIVDFGDNYFSKFLELFSFRCIALRYLQYMIQLPFMLLLVAVRKTNCYWSSFACTKLQSLQAWNL